MARAESETMTAASVAASGPVLEYLGQVRAALADLPSYDVESLISHVQAEIELEADSAYVDGTDEPSVRAMLARIGSPTAVAERLRSGRIASSANAAPALTRCRVCKREISREAAVCPHCGAPYPGRARWTGTGYEWRSPGQFRGWPLVHIAWGRDANGKLRVARGVIAIGQFGIGAITIAQFGVGLIFGFGQFVLAPLAVGQFAFGLLAAGQFGIGLIAGAGQIATGIFAAGMKAFGMWTRSSM